MKFKVGEMVEFKEGVRTESGAVISEDGLEMKVISYRGENIVYVKVMADFGWVCNSHFDAKELEKV